MIATAVLVAGGLILVFASGGSIPAFLVGSLLLGVAAGRVIVWRRRDNTPVTRDELRRWTEQTSAGGERLRRRLERWKRRK